MRRLIPILLLSLLLPLAVQADEAALDITRFAMTAMGAVPDVPSLGIAIVRDGKPYYTRALGVRDREHSIKADQNTVYYIASSTKSYVGLLAAVMAKRGVIDLDAPLTKYFPDTKFPDRVTLRTMLTHTSGVRNDAITFRTAYSGEYTQQQLVDILKYSTVVEPKYEYDNLGYVVTGLVLERVTGKKWQDLLRDEIFKPLGMTHTSAYISAAAKWPMAAAYNGSEKLTFVKTDRTMHAAGGIVTTPVDLAKWLAANINRSVLPASAYEEAQKSQVPITDTERAGWKATAYGFGWNLAEDKGARVLFHMGGYEGWRAHVSFMPDEKIGVAVVTNTGTPGAVVRDLVANYIYDRLRGKADEAAFETKVAELKKRVATAYERMAAETEKRSKRPPSLGHDPATYEGVYEGPTFGTLTIARKDSGLQATIGPLKAKLEPYTQPETARVELIPGNGEVLWFTVEGGKAVAVKYGDEVLKRK